MTSNNYLQNSIFADSGLRPKKSNIQNSGQRIEEQNFS